MLHLLVVMLLLLVELNFLLLGIHCSVRHGLRLDLRCDLLEVLIPQLHRRHLQIVLILTRQLCLRHI